MTTVIESSSDGTGMHVGIAVASWNQAITDRLLDGALGHCDRLGVETVTVLRVPGALELPLAAQKLARAGCDAVVAIGTVIKGDTDHYEIVVRESSAGITRVALDEGIPVGNAILAVHEYGDALERAQEGEANKGAEAVLAAVTTANALAEFSSS